MAPFCCGIKIRYTFNAPKGAGVFARPISKAVAKFLCRLSSLLYTVSIKTMAHSAMSSQSALMNSGLMRTTRPHQITFMNISLSLAKCKHSALYILIMRRVNGGMMSTCLVQSGKSDAIALCDVTKINVNHVQAKASSMCIISRMHGLATSTTMI